MEKTDRTWQVVYMEVVPDEVVEIIASRLPPGFKLSTLRDYPDKPESEALSKADFVLVATHPLPADLIASAKNLRLIQHQGVGYDKTDVQAAHTCGIPVALCPKGTTVGVAEHTILLILAVYKQLIIADQSVRDGDGKQSLLVQPRVGVQEQVVQVQRAYKLAQPILDVHNIIAFPQDPCNLPGFGTGGQQVERAFRARNTVAHVKNRLLDFAFSPQIIVKSVSDVVLAQAEQDVDTRRWNVTIYDADALAFAGHDGC